MDAGLFAHAGQRAGNDLLFEILHDGEPATEVKVCRDCRRRAPEPGDTASCAASRSPSL